MELQDVLRVAGVGLVIALLHVFFEQTGKKEFSFFIFFIAYLYMTAELIRFLRLFFNEIITFFQWLTSNQVLMTFLFYSIILLLLLILIKESINKLHALIAIIFFFILLHFLMSMLVIPFIGQLLSYVNSVPYVSQLVYSALFYQLGLFFQMLFNEQEYETIGEMVIWSVRIVLLTYWASEFAKVLSNFASILERLQ